MAIALLVSFFLPYAYYNSTNFSGLDLIRQGTSSLRFIYLAIPLSALVLLGGAFAKGKYEKGLFHWLPFITIVLVGFFASRLELNPHYENTGIVASFFKALKGTSFGAWITAAVAILLLFGNLIATKPNK